MAAMEGGGGGPVEITMSLLEDELPLGCRRLSVFFDIQFADRQIEVTATDDDRVVARWIRDVHRLHRERVRGGRCGGGSRDLVVGLCTFRRKPWMPSKKQERDAAKRDDYRVSAMSLCAGGPHCLVVPVDGDDYGRRRRTLPHSLAVFLADPHNTFVGIGIKKAAERLERACGIHVANATELQLMVAWAFGRQAVPPFKGGGGDADGLRWMARVALKGFDAGKKPATIEFDDWCLLDSDEKIMYAAVDAFLTFEVSEACLDAIKACGSYSYDSNDVL